MAILRANLVPIYIFTEGLMCPFRIGQMGTLDPCSELIL